MSDRKHITRCAKWIMGRQCSNYASGDSKFCAIHKAPERGRV